MLAGVLCLLLSVTTAEAAAVDGWIKMGMRGATVSQVQQRLQDMGYYSGDVDRVFGSETKIAVISFQGDQGLMADGVVGTATLQAMKAACGESEVSHGAVSIAPGK